MINVTEKAREELGKLLATYTDMPQGRLRLIDRSHGKLGLGLDIEMPGDELVEYDGSTVLVIERQLADSFEELILDAEDSIDGVELVISCH